MQMQKGGEIGHEGENYVSAIDGNDLVLTVDFTIHSIVEKYLEACRKYPNADVYVSR